MDDSNLQPASKLGAAYIRYSSNMQDDSFSLDAQLRQIHTRAASEGVEIVKVYADPAISAYKNNIRPGVSEMLVDSKHGMFEILYVHKTGYPDAFTNFCIVASQSRVAPFASPASTTAASSAHWISVVSISC